MSQAVDTALLRDLVADGRAFQSQTQSKAKASVAPSGSVQAHSREVPGINLVDRIAESFARRELADEIAKRIRNGG